jgi:hypothetical protein
MKQLQKVGGVAALVLAATKGISAIFLVVALRGGLSTSDVLYGSAKGLASQEGHASMALVQALLFGFPYALALIILALALYERWSSKAAQLAGTATILAVVAFGFYLSLAVTILVGMPGILQIYGQDHTQGLTAYFAFNVVTLGLRQTGAFALGCFLLVVSWIVLRTRDVPRPIAYLAMVAGAGFILRGFVAPLTVGLVGDGALVVWAVWLGILMLRSRSMVASPARQTAAMAQSGRVADLP